MTDHFGKPLSNKLYHVLSIRSQFRQIEKLGLLYFSLKEEKIIIIYYLKYLRYYIILFLLTFKSLKTQGISKAINIFWNRQFELFSDIFLIV